MSTVVTLTYDNHDFSDDDALAAGGGTSANPTGWLITESAANRVGLRDGDPTGGVDAIARLGDHGGVSRITNLSTETFNAAATQFEFTVRDLGGVNGGNSVQIFIDVNGDGVSDNNEMLFSAGIGASHTVLSNNAAFAAGSASNGFNLNSGSIRSGRSVTRTYTLDLTGLTTTQKAAFAGAQIGVQFASTSTAAGYGVESASGKMVVCFAGGTRITTPDGQIAVENLKTGDKVTTADGLTETITWIGKRVLNAQELAENPNLRPIRIKRNVLGPGYPDRDLRVSPQHRILMSGNRVMRGNLTSSFFRWCTSPSQSFIRKCRNV